MANPYLVKHPEAIAEEYQFQGMNPENRDDEAIWDNELRAESTHYIASENELFSRYNLQRIEHQENKNMRLTDERFLELN
jgi:hypothetical protein